MWTEHAVAAYRAAFADDADRTLGDDASPWVYRHRPTTRDQRGAREYRLTVWGRRLRSADGSVCELRLPVNRLHSEPPPAAFVAVAALVLAEGVREPLPERVRIIEFALLDGRTRVLADDTRDEALARYREHGPAALTAVLDTHEYRPGPVCVDCPFLASCPAVRKSTGLLGVASEGRPRRTWSVTNGRNYRDCPARDHMRRLHLPAADSIERGSAAERGRAIHTYLADRHGRGDARPCTVDVPAHWVPEGYDLPASERDLGATLLRRHAAVCPLQRIGDMTDVRVEPRVVRHDTAADILVLAVPDLLYRDNASWVWRETKTTATTPWAGRPLLERYPQLALAVMLLARGDLGGEPRRARVELEVLRPDGADLEIIDPFAPATRASAGRIITALVAGWSGDDHYAPTPGRACRRCEVAQWCTSAASLEVTE
ncbi:PD-(D/E)XK nuclease family protein [Streptomyces liangshanensis]|uniref:PD-(D/E)XK nuclease family protein n=1 Tax=Streptomyces liangshanensis TaxID=2717324 RepID=UPI001FB8EEBB|nr:PD-(D/E)XK nuclease family protein [Streptomyces liangshanensis]